MPLCADKQVPDLDHIGVAFDVRSNNDRTNSPYPHRRVVLVRFRRKTGTTVDVYRALNRYGICPLSDSVLHPSQLFVLAFH